MSGKDVSGQQPHFDLWQMGESIKRGRHLTECRLLVLFFALLLSSNALTQELTDLELVLKKGNTEEKRTALMQLRSLGSEAASRTALIALKDRNATVRATAASSILFLPSPEAVRALSPLLSDKDEFVRREAAFALGETSDPSAASILGSALINDKSVEVRTAAAAAVGKTGEPSSVSTLIQVLSNRPNEDNEMLRRAAARSIGQIAQIMRGGASRVLTPQNFLPERLKDVGNEPTTALLALFAESVRTLVRIVESSQEADDTRREAAFSLGAIGDPASQNLLTKYTASPDPYMAEIAREALLKLGKPQ